MFDGVHRRMCEAVRCGDLVLTLHADEELESDKLSVLDVEHAILSGRIVERQRDAELDQWKYVLCGPSMTGREIGLVARLSRNKKTIIITVYRMQSSNGRHP